MNAQRQGPCTFLDLLLLHFDNLQSNFQITGLRKKNCIAALFSEAVRFKFSFDLIWPEILTSGLEVSTSHSFWSLLCNVQKTLNFYLLQCELRVHGSYQGAQLNIISSFP